MLSWLTGKTWLLLAIGLIAFAAGLYVGDMRGDAGRAGKMESIASDQAKTSLVQNKALVTLVQNAGRREMNYLWREQAERAQFVETVETFQKWDQLGTEAKTAANARAAKLKGDLQAQSAKYDNLVKSYEGADKNTTSWLNTDLPDGFKCVRYADAGCSADYFAAAGYPAPPDHPPAVGQPPH